MAEWFTWQNIPNPQSPEDVLSEAISEYKPVRVFACFSSGNDSIVSTHIAMKHGAHEVFNINTGIGIPEAREHFYRVCDQFQWPFRVKVPPELSYEEMVLRFGFPGPGAHTYPYVWLKQRAIKELVRETKKDWADRVMLVTGVRESESARRMGFVEPIHRDGATVWVAPIYSFDVKQRDAYMQKHGLPRSPVSDLIHISGECCCGAFTHKGERKELALWFPHFEAALTELERKAREAKQPYCEWGNGRRVDLCQGDLFTPMCADCNVPQAK